MATEIEEKHCACVVCPCAYLIRLNILVREVLSCQSNFWDEGAVGSLVLSNLGGRGCGGSLVLSNLGGWGCGGKSCLVQFVGWGCGGKPCLVQFGGMGVRWKVLSCPIWGDSCVQFAGLVSCPIWVVGGGGWGWGERSCLVQFGGGGRREEPRPVQFCPWYN